MEFKNGYNFMYQKLKSIYASKTGRPNDTDVPADLGLTEEDINNLKLVYETKEGLAVSFKNYPTPDDKYFEVTVNGELVLGPSGNVPPTPGEMVRFYMGQRVKGYYFGNVKNGDVNEELEEYLFSLDEAAILVAGGSEEEFGALIAGADEIEEGHKVGVVYTATEASGGVFVLYATEDFEFSSDFRCKKGYNNLTDGKFICPEFTVIEMNEGTDDSWNAKFIGAIEGEPGPSGTVVTTGENIKSQLDSLSINTDYISAHLGNLTFNTHSDMFGDTHVILYGEDLASFEANYDDMWNLFTISKEGGKNEYQGYVFITPVLMTDHKNETLEVFGTKMSFDGNGWVYQVEIEEGKWVHFTVKDAIINMIQAVEQQGETIDAYYVDTQLNDAFTY